MTLLAILLSASFAQDFNNGSYRYKIFSEHQEDTQWVVEALNGFYNCEAAIKCVGLDEGMIIRSRKPTWHDPLIINYVVDSSIKSCELKSCSKLREITCQDLKWPYKKE